MPRKPKEPNTQCATCGKPLRRKPSQLQRRARHFCDDQCWGLALSEQWKGANNPRWTGKILVSCRYCGKELERYEYQLNERGNYFCNIECYGTWRADEIKGENHPLYRKQEVGCAFCGKILLRMPCEFERNENHFCDTECKGAWMSENLRGENALHWTEKDELPCANCGKLGYRTLYRASISEKHFCNTECYSDWQSKNITGENHHNWQGGGVVYYGPNWYRQRQAARSRDDYVCQRCSISEEALGRELDVHHLTPFRTFNYVYGENERYQEANKLSNLISLCPACHRAVENNPALLLRKGKEER